MTKYLSCLLVLVSGCAALRPLPKEHYYPFYCQFRQAFRHDTLVVRLANPLRCPVSVSLAGDSVGDELRQRFGRVRLNGLRDTTITLVYHSDSPAFRGLRYRVEYAAAARPLVKAPVAYPFPARRHYRIIQGYNGKFSHYKPQSRFALDFNLRIGDTISCVDNGVVVGLIDGYSQHGTSQAWRTNDRSNYLTIYHPASGLYSQYVHLQHHGALVRLGEAVRRGQPIGLSGLTGFTTTPHLHFSMKYAAEQGGLLSVAVPFETAKKQKP